MKNDFLKFAIDKGMNSMHVEKTMNASASYISPSILEERQLNVTQMDVFSRLMTVSYTHLRAHETLRHLVCRLLLE